MRQNSGTEVEVQEISKHDRVMTFSTFGEKSGFSALGLRIGAILAGTLLVTFSLYSAIATGRTRERVASDHVLSTEAREHADAIGEYFERARMISLVTAQNPGFANFYPVVGDRLGKVARDGAAIVDAAAALRYVGDLYPTTIEEVCFIDRGGGENARLVRGEAASIETLATDESTNEFFAPTLQLGPGNVYQSRPYRSPDTGEWVISNSTVIEDTDGSRPALVHFEVVFDSFRGMPDADIDEIDLAYLIVDASSGAVISDSRIPQRAESPLGIPDDTRFVAPATSKNTTDTVSGDGYRAAMRPVRTPDGNQNDWLVVVVGASPKPGVLAGVGPGVVSSLIAAMCLLAFAFASSRRNRRRLQIEATTDHLTSLPNRAMFAQRAGVAITNDRSTAVMLVDLDRFKQVNDTLGHRYGDAVLVAVGPRILSVISHHDTVARLGGDEFGIVVSGVSSSTAIAIARRIQAKLCEPFGVDDLSLEVEASIGVAISPDHGTTFDQLLQHADVAMYAAKSARTGVELYDLSIDSNSRSRLSLLSDVRRGLERNEFELFYQAKHVLTDDSIAGYEALLRWQHPTRGLLYPVDFVDAVEQSSLIEPLTEWIIDDVVGHLAKNSNGSALPISANVSARSIAQPGFAALIEHALVRHRVAPRLLILEITETALMPDGAHSRSNLQQLARLGVELSVDDFGTGFSSLAYLSAVELHELKIDQSFVQSLTTEPRAAVIVTSIVQLGRNLGLRVVAEGVESATTRDRLVEMGCHLAQGYYWGPPRPLRTEQTSDARTSPTGSR